ARGDRDGRLREPAEWRLVFLSAGEIDLVTHLESEGLRVQAGQQIRLLSIDADVGNQLGVFENIHDFASSSEFAEHLRFNALRYYGAPIRAFLSQLTALDKAQEKIQKYKADFRKNFEKPRYQGYLVIDSQPAKRWGIRDQDGHLRRKPLKGRKKIDEKSARIIPVIDEQLWKDLVILYNETLLQHKQKLWGEDLKNYLLFPTINSTSSSVLYRAFMKLQLRYRSWHCLRHTRATLLIGQTGDFLLTRMWLGHKKQEILERYIHVYQAIVRNAKKKATKNPRPLKF
ncbi:MAG: hypothetical protein HYW48_09720, partial [Deltaproteobacteria bacterium]|nr:hypothetical protein [Deltaproteobacteria bacterium]